MAIETVLRAFGLSDDARPFGNGHINTTFLCDHGTCVVQQINTDVFHDPAALMENVNRVTDFLRVKIAAEGGDPMRETLKMLSTVDGKAFYTDADGKAWRAYRFIGDTWAPDTCEDPALLEEAGRAFGRFQRMLDDFPVDVLHETIPDFHNTPKRVDALKTAIREDRAGRAASVQAEIQFALDCASFADTVTNGLADGSIPYRVTHNDTKVNNVLFDNKTNRAVAVIDLDTVMPGSAIYDFGDALRIGGSSAAEDETDLSKVWFREETFVAFLKGYFGEMRPKLKPREIELLPFAAKLMTYECGIRFLTDYLNGDTYFRIHREHHNLDRARNQFKLVADLIEKEDRLKKILSEMK